MSVARVEDIQALHVDIAALRSELAVLKASVQNIDLLRHEALQLNREVLHERTKVRALSEELDLGLAVVFDYERFRLDDAGALPGGVGTTETLPISVFLSWEPVPDVSVTVFAGATVYGRVKATNAVSQDVYASNYDPAAVLGIQGGIRF